MMMVMNALSENDVITLSATSTAPHIVAGLRSWPVKDHFNFDLIEFNFDFNFLRSRPVKDHFNHDFPSPHMNIFSPHVNSE